MKLTVDIESYVDEFGVNRLKCTTPSVIGCEINNALHMYAAFQRMRPHVDFGDSILSDINDKLSDLSKIFKSTNSELGELGEQFVYNMLRDLTAVCDGSCVQRVNSIGNSCDMYLVYGRLKCGVEVKNHASPIGAREIDRFLEVDIANESYNCGLFISLKSGFTVTSKICHFKIVYAHGKPCIFIGDGIDNKHAITIAIKVLAHLLDSKQSTGHQEVVSKVSKMLRQVELISKANNSALKSIKESNLVISEMKKEIEYILSPSVKKSKHHCELCDYGTDKKVDLNRHMKKEH